MSESKNPKVTRRGFMHGAGALAAAAFVGSSSKPSVGQVRGANDRIGVGFIGCGGRSGAHFRAVRWLKTQGNEAVEIVAACDVYRPRLAQRVEDFGGKAYMDHRELLADPNVDVVCIATPDHVHGYQAIDAIKAGKDVYCEKPCTKNIAQSLALADVFRRTGRVFQAGTQRRSLPNFAYAAELAHSGRLGQLVTLHAHPGGLGTSMSGWLPAEPEPPRDQVDWDAYLGPAAWRPYNRKLLDGFNFEKGGGMVGGGCLEWGSHCVDLCQWANQSDDTAPVEYEPVNGQLHARYANGVKLVMRNDGWLPLGSCPVRYEGTTGWVETGDDAEFGASSPDLLTRRGAKIPGYPADFHVRDFLDCVKSRAQTRANADAACWAHIACHAANVALFLNRKVRFDPQKCEFIGDEQANRLRSEALREPWRI